MPTTPKRPVSVRLVQRGARLAVLLCLVGCAKTGIEMSRSSAGKLDQATVLPVSQVEATTATTTAANRSNNYPRSLPFDVCGEQPNWQRPDPQTYYATLQAHPRYADGLTEEPLKSLYEKFWQASIFSFTTYGLSARMEPILLSGIGDTIDQMEGCYAGDRPNAINRGTLAELWLLGYQIRDILWTGQTYQVTVKQTTEGLQFVQFERQETNASLPIVVVREDGQEITVASGDE